MIVIKTPYRISFFGGGTDYPEWYRSNIGMVISTTINKYSYLTIKNLYNFFNYKFIIRYYFREEAKSLKAIKHPVVKKLLEYFKIKKHLEIIHYGDLPARSGIGSSSSFAVGLIHGLNLFIKKKKISKKNLAKKTMYIEQKVLKESVGSQDSVASTYGGFNKIIFNKKSFLCKPIKISQKNKNILESWVQLFYTRQKRNSFTLEKEKIKKIKVNHDLIIKNYNIAIKAEEILKSKNNNFIYKFAALLNKQWQIKKKFAKRVSNPYLDKIYNLGIKNGAVGGKVLGAGGGGFIMFLTPPHLHKKLINKIKLPHVNVKFETGGSKVMYNFKTK